MAADLDPSTATLSGGQRETLRAWSSLAQWIGTPKGADAIVRVEEVWPGYGSMANASILNAYYTDPGIIATVWAWLARNGVTGGHGFEPGCGRGDWMAGAPVGVSFDGVDIDPISVRVARLLTGRNVVECPLEMWDLSRSSRPEVAGYDVVVGNVPFSSIRPARNNPHHDNLHNLAVARSVDMLRPGGVATVITSRFALDADASRTWRERLATDVDLVGAFRLPAGTHHSAGTDVVTDLLVLRRPHPGENRPVAEWVDTVPVDVAGETFRHNAHFAAYPERVLGRYEPGGVYRRENLNVVGTGIAARVLADALAVVTVDYHPAGAARQQVRPVAVTESGRRLPAGSIVVDAGSPTGFVRDGAVHRVARTNRPQVRALCELRDVVLDYLDRPSDEARDALAALYGNYRRSWPPLGAYTLVPIQTGTDGDGVGDSSEGEVTRFRRRYPGLDGFRTDPSWWTVAALEHFDDETGVGVPAAILQRPIIDTGTGRWPTAAASLPLAIANSLARFHRLDDIYVAEQLAIDVPTAQDLLRSVAFEVPAGGWEIADTYLAGDIVAKLDTALAAVVTDPRFERHVRALTGVLPTALTQAEISPELGVTWLTAPEITGFVAATAGEGTAVVRYHPPTGRWSSDGWAPAGPASFRTDRYGVLEQVVRACNATPVTVTVKISDGDGNERVVVDADATAAEQLARDNLNEALQAWCWADPVRATTLTERYNRLFNRYRPVAYDGAHLTLPGLATDFVPRPHQKDAVWRILTATDTGVLLAHGVGAGKTAAMIIAGHEARRTGRVIGTTLFAVPATMVEQFAGDYLRLYPAARVIAPTGTDRDAIRHFAARVATGDFDAAICSHTTVKTIPMHPDTHRANLQRRIDELTATDETVTLSRHAQRLVERRKAKLTEQLRALTDAAEDPTVVYFDRLGIGMLVVDEAHLAKNIALNTARDGLPMPEPSQ